MTGCKLTLSRKGRERAKVTTNTREEIARPARPTRGVQTSTRARTGPVDHGCDSQFRVIHKGEKQVPSICFLTVANSFTPVQSLIQDKRNLCLTLECTQQVEQDSNMTEDDR